MDTVVSCFKGVSYHLPRVTEENQRNFCQHI